MQLYKNQARREKHCHHRAAVSTELDYTALSEKCQ